MNWESFGAGFMCCARGRRRQTDPEAKAVNEYKFQQRRKKRGEHCVLSPFYIGVDGGRVYRTGGDGRCGCGQRTSPSKRHKTRIIRRELQRLLVRDSA